MRWQHSRGATVRPGRVAVLGWGLSPGGCAESDVVCEGKGQAWVWAGEGLGRGL